MKKVLLALLIGGSTLFSTQVILIDGTIINGEIISISDEELQIKVSYSEDLFKINRNQILDIKFDESSTASPVPQLQPYVALSSQNSVEYSIGLSDKLGYFGGISKSWIKHQSGSRESYIVAGSTLFFLGGIGYGQKVYFHKGKKLSSYFSPTGSGYYALGIGAVGSLNITGAVGLNLKIFDWGRNKLFVQFGVVSMYDPVRGESLVIAGEGGPSFLMPSFNIKVNRGK